MKIIKLLEDAKKLAVVRVPGIDTGEVVKINDREYSVHMDIRDKNAGHQLTFVGDKFDKQFSENEDFYVGSNGEGGIGNRYEKFGEWLKGADFLTIPDVSISKSGTIMFGNGRHRYAWMRNNGVSRIPVAMDSDSFGRARKLGLVV